MSDPMDLMVPNISSDSLYNAILIDTNIRILLTIEWHKPNENNLEFSIRTLDMAILYTNKDISIERILKHYGISCNDIINVANNIHYSTKIEFIDNKKMLEIEKIVNKKCKETFKAQQVNYIF